MSIFTRHLRLAYFIIGCILVLPWINPYTSFPIVEFTPWLMVLFCCVLILICGDKINESLVIASWVVAAGITALMGLLQYFFLAEALSPWLDQPNPGTAFGNLRQRNHFATLTSIGLISIIGWLAAHSVEKKMPWWVKYLALLLALGNAASNSRTGMLEWILVVFLSGWWFYSTKKWLFAFALKVMLIYLVAIFALPSLLEILTGIRAEGLMGRLSGDPTCESRTILWSNVLFLIAKKPWLGWGWGGLKYAHFAILFPEARFCGAILGNAHNLPLQLAVTLGIPAAILACGGFIAFIFFSKPWCEINPVRQVAWGVILVILVHSMLEYPLWHGPFMLAFGLCFWILLRPRIYNKQSKSQVYNNFLHVVKIIMTIALLAGCGILTWEYHKMRQIYLPPSMRDFAYRENTLAKIRHSWIFSDRIRFAELSLTPLTLDNAQWTYDTATAMLHFSPEPMVIKKLIESATILGYGDKALEMSIRFRIAFPIEYNHWAMN